MIARAAALLRAGRLVAFPTETVYGLGAHALDRTAVRRLFEVKGRPSIDPVIVHVASLDQVGPVVADLPEAARRLAAAFWPGPLTLVLPRSTTVPDEVTAGLATVGVRIPSHPVARALIGEAGVPVAAPSANLFSRPSPTLAAHVLQDLDGRLDLVVDAGPTSIGVESTVLDLSGSVPRVLRPGAVTLDMLRSVVPDVTWRHTSASAASADALASPGLLDRHYSPRAPLILYEGSATAVRERLGRDAEAAAARGQRVGLLVQDDEVAALSARVPRADVARLGSRRDAASTAARLYAGLRQLDQRPVDLILAEAPAETDGLSLAIRDRLRRAAAGRTVSC